MKGERQEKGGEGKKNKGRRGAGVRGDRKSMGKKKRNNKGRNSLFHTVSDGFVAQRPTESGLPTAAQ